MYHQVGTRFDFDPSSGMCKFSLSLIDSLDSRNECRVSILSQQKKTQRAIACRCNEALIYKYTTHAPIYNNITDESSYTMIGAIIILQLASLLVSITRDSWMDFISRCLLLLRECSCCADKHNDEAFKF